MTGLGPPNDLGLSSWDRCGPRVPAVSSSSVRSAGGALRGVPWHSSAPDSSGLGNLYRVGPQGDSSEATQICSGTPLKTAAIEPKLPQTVEPTPTCLADNEAEVSAIGGHSLDRGQRSGSHNMHGGILSEEPLQGGTAQGHS